MSRTYLFLFYCDIFFPNFFAYKNSRTCTASKKRQATTINWGSRLKQQKLKVGGERLLEGGESRSITSFLTSLGFYSPTSSSSSPPLIRFTSTTRLLIFLLFSATNTETNLAFYLGAIKAIKLVFLMNSLNKCFIRYLLSAFFFIS